MVWNLGRLLRLGGWERVRSWCRVVKVWEGEEEGSFSRSRGGVTSRVERIDGGFKAGN